MGRKPPIQGGKGERLAFSYWLGRNCSRYQLYDTMGFIDAKRNALVWLGCYRVLYRGDVCHYFGGQTGMTTPDIAGLCERLRASHGRAFRLKAADTLERQAAEIERLRGALRDIKALPDRSKNPADAFDRGARAARLDAADMAEAALTGEDA